MTQLQQVTTQQRGHGLPALQDVKALFDAQNNSAVNNLVAQAASGVLPVVAGSYFLTGTSAEALTLAAPIAGSTGQDGLRIYVYSATAFAHTISSPGNLLNGTGAKSLATFAANAGASLSLVAYGGKWMMLTAVAVTFS